MTDGGHRQGGSGTHKPAGPRDKAVMTERAPGRRRLKGLGIAALLIFAIALAIFIGLNIWHASEAAG